VLALVPEPVLALALVLARVLPLVHKLPEG